MKEDFFNQLSNGDETKIEFFNNLYKVILNQEIMKAKMRLSSLDKNALKISSDKNTKKNLDSKFRPPKAPATIKSKLKKLEFPPVRLSKN